MRTRLPSDVYAPGAARRFVTTGLRGVLTSAQKALSDDLALIVSELVTNSVRAQARTIEVEVRVDDEAVEVRVSDDAGGWPTTQDDVDANSVEGRGLEIVGLLADSWRTVPQRGGKCVIATRSRRRD